MVFQDSYASLNPRLPIEDSIAFAPRVHGLPGGEAADGRGSCWRRWASRPRSSPAATRTSCPAASASA
jgi:peptide/nickel transport system ATP-binding protein